MRKLLKEGLFLSQALFACLGLLVIGTELVFGQAYPGQVKPPAGVSGFGPGGRFGPTQPAGTGVVPGGGLGPKVPAGGGGSGGKAPAKKEKSKLEEMLATALQHNADIRLAAAKLAEADAELSRARMQTAEKVVALHHAWLAQKNEVKKMEAHYNRLMQLRAQKVVSSEEVKEREFALLAAKIKLAEIETQIPLVLGKTTTGTKDLNIKIRVPDPDAPRPVGGSGPGGMGGAMGPPPQPLPGEVSIMLHRVLETPVKLPNFKKTRLSTILQVLRDKVPNLSFRNLYGSDPELDLEFDQPLPVGAILQALGDTPLPPEIPGGGPGVGGLGPIPSTMVFLVREYGILIVPRSHVPPGAMDVQGFRRSWNDHP